MIQPEIWTDEGFLSLSISARLMFIGMISGADDEGRGLATDRCLKARIFPADDVTLEQVRKYRDEVAAAVNVRIYDVDDKKYYELRKWRNHQRLERPSKSIIPPAPSESGIDTGLITDTSGTLHPELKKELKKESMCDGFDDFWTLYPRHVNRVGAMKAWNARLKDKTLVTSEVMAAVTNYVRTVAGKELEYVMHPATFLGPGLRWKDYLVTGSKYVPAAAATANAMWVCTMCGKEYGKAVPRYIGGVCKECKEAAR
jgi:hypothetical protein